MTQTTEQAKEHRTRWAESVSECLQEHIDSFKGTPEENTWAQALRRIREGFVGDWVRSISEREPARLGDEIDEKREREFPALFGRERDPRERREETDDRNDAAAAGFERPDEWCETFIHWGHLPGMVCCSDPDDFEAHEVAQGLLDVLGEGIKIHHRKIRGF